MRQFITWAGVVTAVLGAGIGYIHVLQKIGGAFGYSPDAQDAIMLLLIAVVCFLGLSLDWRQEK